MVPAFSPVLFPPVLLATDGSAGALQAQKLACAIAQALRPTAEHSPATAQGDGVGLVVLSVQPRQRQRLASARKLGQTLRATVNLAERDLAQQAIAPTTARDRATQVAPPPAPPSTGAALSAQSLASLVEPDWPSSLPVDLVIREGRPTVEILNHAQAVGAGLIVVGHRGRGGMRELLLGSVSTAIARYAPCSVLVARRSGLPPVAAPESSETATPPRFRHLLVVVSRSAVSRVAIATANQLLHLGVTQVTLLYVCPPLNANHLFGPVAVQTPNWQLEQSLQEAQREQGHDVLTQAQAALSHAPTVTINAIARTGDPGPIICQTAIEVQADLVLLGSDPTRRSLLSHFQVRRHTAPPPNPAKAKQRPILRNTRLSVTDDYTIHYAPCPVLLCRPQPHFRA